MLLSWVGGGLLCIVVLAWFSVSYLAQRLHVHENNLLEAQITIEANSRQQKNFSTLSKQVAEIQGHAQELNRAFPDRTKALEFIEFIEATAAQENVEQSFNPIEPTRTAATSLTAYLVEERGFRLTLKGKTPNLFRFLTALEVNPVYLLTTSVSLSRDDKGEATMDLQGTIPWH